ncbi:undecaprenyl-diphosphate phosphatase [Staphylospora marina]|uniref:undecaprenyl-diphosphate phosphatase n=1 Tax=Staphylospora marina TaxID=2490858 RepID=UPI000F5C0100|nr:undecaprenyl-diphosphate phosphatase [Staphylospora marina]
MNWLEALILGIIQGLTEFLPVSSTGHLLLGRHLFGLEEAGLFLDTMLHFGTLLAVLTVYRKEIFSMIRRPLDRPALLILAGTVPTAAVGLLFEDAFEELSRTGITVGWEFLATGLILWMADRHLNRGVKTFDEIRFRHAALIGLAQGAAILPALSRSGLTIAAAVFCRLRKQDAAAFSFLLSVPAIAGGVLLQGKKLLEGGAPPLPLSSLLLGTAAAALSGYIAVRWMISLINRGSLKGFAVYVTVLGLIVLALQAAGKF